MEALDAGYFVRVRNIIGGPAPEQTRDALSRALKEQESVEEWIQQKQALVNSKNLNPAG